VAAKLACKRIGEFGRDAEHFLGVPEDDLSGFGEIDIATAPGEERDLEARFERSDLRANRGLCEAEFFGGACQVAVLADEPEVVEVVVVHR